MAGGSKVLPRTVRHSSTNYGYTCCEFMQPEVDVGEFRPISVFLRFLMLRFITLDHGFYLGYIATCWNSPVKYVETLNPILGD